MAGIAIRDTEVSNRMMLCQMKIEYPVSPRKPVPGNAKILAIRPLPRARSSTIITKNGISNPWRIKNFSGCSIPGVQPIAITTINAISPQANQEGLDRVGLKRLSENMRVMSIPAAKYGTQKRGVLATNISTFMLQGAPVTILAVYPNVGMIETNGIAIRAMIIWRWDKRLRVVISHGMIR